MHKMMMMTAATVVAMVSTATRADTYSPYREAVKGCRMYVAPKDMQSCVDQLAPQLEKTWREATERQGRHRAPEVLVVPQDAPRPVQTFCEPVFGQPGQVACQSY